MHPTNAGSRAPLQVCVQQLSAPPPYHVRVTSLLPNSLVLAARVLWVEGYSCLTWSPRSFSYFLDSLPAR